MTALPRSVEPPVESGPSLTLVAPVPAPMPLERLALARAHHGGLVDDATLAAWYADLPLGRRPPRRWPQPCRRCGAPRPAGMSGCPYCPTCKPLSARQQLLARAAQCSRPECANPKRPGAGQRYCEDCHLHYRRYHRKGEYPCRRCFDGQARPGRGWCDECAALEHEAMLARRAAKRAWKRKPCPCGARRAGPTHSPYCVRCQAERATRRCPCGKVIARKNAKKCDACRAAGRARSAARKKAQHAERMRTSPEYRAKRAAQLARSAASRAKRKDESRETMLPTGPLGVAVLRVAAQDMKGGNPWAQDNPGDSCFEITCERADVLPRTVAGWRSERTVKVGAWTADKVMTRLGLAWWQVWNEQTMRRPVITATTYRHYPKKTKWGVRVYRERTSTRRYGDQGPDLEGLAAVREHFEGDLRRVA